MNKITKKLFTYFTMITCLFAVIVFIGFFSVFQYYSIRHQEEELQIRAETIRIRLENYMNSCTETQELSAYIKVLDDISMADAYFISLDGETFTCSCSCNTTVIIEKRPTPEVEKFSRAIFSSGEFMQIREKTSDNMTQFFVGIPVKEAGKTTAVVVIVDTPDINQGSYWLAISVLLVCIILALILSAFLSGFMAKRFMKPIQKIANTTKELASGNYQVKTEVSEKNEIGDLAKETDVLAEKLDFANKESERMKQMQKKYIANISHELRTPVAVIRSTIEALHDGVVPAEKVSSYQKQMLSETIALQRLVNDMLELSRLENEDFPIEKEMLDLQLVLEDAVRTIRMVAREKNIQIHFNCTAEEWPFEGDYGRLRQMFLAVLDNAVKYSATDKNVWIEATAKKEYYFITVRDEGFGIEEEKQVHVFDKFYRISHEGIGGTGLGMAISKSIAKRHLIDIRLQSASNVGTKITFIAPVYKVDGNKQ